MKKLFIKKMLRAAIPNGIYAISLQGSNREYLAPLDKMFCAAPINTASIRGVVPNLQRKCNTIKLKI